MIISETVKEGKITHISGRSAIVAVSCDDDACAGCRLSGMCVTSKDDIRIKARIETSERPAVGDDVLVIGRLKGWLASWMLLAGIPCGMILGSLIGGFAIGLRDGIVGCSALVIVALYYVMLWIFRSRLEKRVEWIVTAKNNKPKTGTDNG